jgi:hypothetical protein
MSNESTEVTVPYGENAGETATLLLAAAEKLHENQGLVRTVEGAFMVPKDVADEAGVDYDDPDADTQEASVTDESASKDAEQQKAAAKKAAPPKK